MSFPRYPKYKDSGVDWIGKVPEHWDLPKIKSITTFSGGGTPSRDNLAFWNGQIPWVSPKDMKAERIIGAEESITENGLENSATSLVPIGRVLMVVRSGILKHTIPVAINETAVALNQDMKALNFDPHRCLSRFFLRWAQGLNDVLLTAWAKQGATVESLEQNYIANTVIPLPSVVEQSQIAEFLDRETAKIDALVAEQRRLLELLKEKRQAVISHAVTKGLNPYAPMKPSGIEWLGDVPEHWEVCRLATLFREVTEAGSDELPILSVSIHSGVSDDELDAEAMDRKITRIEDRSKYKRVAPGDLVYNMMRAWQGGFGTVAVDGMVSPAYVVARPQRAIVTAYCEHLLRTPQAIEQMRRHSRGVTDFRLRLYWEEFKNIRIAFPPAHEAAAICERISEIVGGFVSLSEGCEQTIALLQERRSVLISAAVTGQIDVRGSAAQKPA